MGSNEVPDGVVVASDGSTVRIVLRGEIDGSMRDDLLTAGQGPEVRGQHVVVDLTDVTFMDSTGIGFLVRLRAVAAGTVQLIDPDPFVAEMLEVAGVDELFDIVPHDGGRR